MKAKFNKRKSAMVMLDDIYHNDSDYIELCQWSNGEGWDISISDKTIFSLHYTEYEAIKKLIKKLNNEENF